MPQLLSGSEAQLNLMLMKIRVTDIEMPGSVAIEFNTITPISTFPLSTLRARPAL